MSTYHVFRRAVLLVSLAVVCGCHAPRRDYDLAQIESLTSLEELMDVQATVADPRFSLARDVEGQQLSEAQFAEFVDMGRRLQATAGRLHDFSKGPAWDRHADTLVAQATEVERAAANHDGPRTTDTALAIKKTCAACHRAYR